MSWETYEDKCEGCRPVLFDVKTGKKLPHDSPTMQVILAIFDALTLPEKQAWHRFTCQGSLDPADLKVVASFKNRVEDAIGGRTNA